MRLFGVLCLLNASYLMHGQEASEVAFFEAKIRPLMVERCYSCHSSQAKTPFGGLRLDNRDNVLRGGDRGPAVVPGRPAESLLIQAVKHKVVQMPPGAMLSSDQIA